MEWVVVVEYDRWLMPRESNPQLPNAPEQGGNAEQDVNAAALPEGSIPVAEVTPTVANFRKGFMKDSRFEVFLGMGEGEYWEMMEFLLEDLQPRRGLESHLVEQMGETFWRMRRSQRIRDGLALKNIKVPGEDMAATVRSSQAFDAMELLTSEAAKLLLPPRQSRGLSRGSSAD
jgi:hypothetical protein